MNSIELNTLTIHWYAAMEMSELYRAKHNNVNLTLSQIPKEKN